ncbi:hypothetical protein FRC06_000911 [Ceratobasidium sp. 370]|nr:hypothetical protein FRC06_000911 [Ceratobasidium sp. 370]
MALDQAAYSPVAAWAQSKGIRAFSRRMHVCEQLGRGHVVYQPFRESRNNSGILFRPRSATAAVPGRIDAILQEPNEGDSQGRIILLVRKFNPLTPQDAAKDPYQNHSIVGASRFDTMSLFYDAVDSDRAHIIEPNDVVSHIAVCGFDSPTGTMSAPCVVIVNLDMLQGPITNIATFEGLEQAKLDA